MLGNWGQDGVASQGTPEPDEAAASFSLSRSETQVGSPTTRSKSVAVRVMPALAELHPQGWGCQEKEEDAGGALASEHLYRRIAGGEDIAWRGLEAIGGTASPCTQLRCASSC